MKSGILYNVFDMVKHRELFVLKCLIDTVYLICEHAVNKIIIVFIVSLYLHKADETAYK